MYFPYFIVMYLSFCFKLQLLVSLSCVFYRQSRRCDIWQVGYLNLFLLLRCKHNSVISLISRSWLLDSQLPIKESILVWRWIFFFIYQTFVLTASLRNLFRYLSDCFSIHIMCGRIQFCSSHLWGDTLSLNQLIWWDYRVILSIFSRASLSFYLLLN